MNWKINEIILDTLDTLDTSRSKGQLISEWLFDVLNFPKNSSKI